MQKFLIGVSYLLMIIGLIIFLLSFHGLDRRHSRRKLIWMGGIGVIIIFCSGLILIDFFYALEPVSERLIKERLDENYPDKSLDVSMQENLHISD